MNQSLHCFSSDWELCKENIKPLKQGRKMAVLQSAVEPDMQHVNQKLMQELKRFESLIRIYQGEDPLDGWCQYIEWIEQNFPKGGKATGLDTLLHECISKFKDEERYQNDSRFVSIFLKYATFAPDALEIYQYMYAEKIGIKRAELFKVWANCLESAGRLKDADCVIKEGLSMNAEPRNDLEVALNYLTVRAIRSANCGEVEADMEAKEPQRTALGGLKSFGLKHKVGVTRTGVARQRDVKLLGQANVKCNANVPMQTKVTPFCDDDKAFSSGFHCRENSVKTQLVVNSNQENVSNPTKWTNVKVPTKHVHEAAKLAFSIHVDPQASQETLKKLPVVNEFGLSVSRKSVSDVDKYQLKAKPKPDNQIFEYCKAKLESGRTEFQFEELRAINWKQKHNLMTKKCEEITTSKCQHEGNIRPLSTRHTQEKTEEKQTVAENSSAVVLESGNIPKFSSLSGEEKTMKEPESENFSCQNERVNLKHFSSREISATKDESISQSITSQPRQLSFLNIVKPLPQQKSQEDPQRCLIESRNPASHVNETRRTEETRSIPFTSFMNVMWNQTVADPILEFIKEESYLLKESSKVKEEASNKPKFSVFHDSGEIIQESHEKDEGKKQSPKFVVFHDDDNENFMPEENVARVKEAPKFAVFRDEDHFKEPDLCQENENKGKSGFSVLHDENTPLVKNLVTQSLPERPVRSCMYSENENNLANPTQFGADFTCDYDFVPPSNEEMSMTCPSTTVFFKNLQISSTPSKRQLSSFASRNEQAGSGQDQTYANRDTIGQLPRRNSNFDFGPTGFGLSPITETSREYKSSSSSGMSSTGGAALSQGRSRLFRSKTQDELSSVAEKTYGSRSKIYIENPYNEAAINDFFQNLTYPLYKCEGFVTCKTKLPSFQTGKTVNLGNDEYYVLDVCGTGAYAKVFSAYPVTNNDPPSNKSRNKIALKVQNPECRWEFYIGNELITRIKHLSSGRFYNVLPSIMNIQNFYHFVNGSVFATDYISHGSLLHLANQYKRNHKCFPEALAMYLSIELLNIIEQIHTSKIIHGDVKPDNILIMGIPNMAYVSEPYTFNEIFGKSTASLKIIDYGRSIDLLLFPPNTVFTHRVLTEDFVCPAMMDNQPWTFQGDLFGVAGCIHVMLFGEYLKINRCGSKWASAFKLKRYWNGDLWEPLMDYLINISDCDDMPDLSSMISSLKECLLTKKMLNEMKQALLELPAVMSTSL